MDLDSLMGIVKTKIGNIIQKPKMADKLLSKPPFRFLHDTITAIIQTTGFAKGLYTDDEMDSAKVADKQQKINYLDKMINLLGICRGKQIDVRSVKIVAGLEPENTNIFLIELAECALDGTLDVDEAVQRTLDGEQPGEGPPAIKKSNRQPKAESKAELAPVIDSKFDNKDDDLKRPDMDTVSSERGKSRGGTRGGKPSQSNGGAGLSGMNARPAGLDSDIEKCDGSWESTRDILGAVIQRPKLTEKLLSKPPFRFLHDIIMEVIRVSGFGTNLYTPEEMDSANIKDKDQKIFFLEKMLKLVGVQLNTLIEAKPARIVAGLEPERTNTFLQLLAVAVKHMPDSANAVRVVLEGKGEIEDDGGLGGAVNEGTAPVRNMVEDKPRAEDKARVDDRPKAEEKSKSKPQAAPAPVLAEREEPSSRDAAEDKSGAAEETEPSADSESKRSMRPTTARRRPPKVKDAASALTVKDSLPTANKKTEGIMIDGQDDDEEEDAVLEEKRLSEVAGAKSVGGEREQSKLVKDILSRQAEQEASRMTPTQESEEAKGEDKASGGIRLGQLRKTGSSKARAVSGVLGASDMERLRQAVQGLVQHTGPLGTCMDYVQEDVGIMTGELHRWEVECRKYEAAIESERVASEGIIRPLQQELAELDKQVEEQLNRISSTKANIARNQDRIQASLRLISTA